MIFACRWHIANTPLSILKTLRSKCIIDGSVLGQIYLNAGTSFTLVAANGNAAFSANNNTGPNNTAITFTYSLL